LVQARSVGEGAHIGARSGVEMLALPPLSFFVSRRALYGGGYSMRSPTGSGSIRPWSGVATSLRRRRCRSAANSSALRTDIIYDTRDYAGLLDKFLNRVGWERCAPMLLAAIGLGSQARCGFGERYPRLAIKSPAHTRFS
jgi:hypothetical protein